MNLFGRMSVTALSLGACLLAPIAFGAAPATAPAPAPIRVGIVQPKAQVDQGSSTSNLGNAVLQALVTDMSGPRVEFVQLKSHAQVQIDAEAQQEGCEYVVYTSVSQVKKQSGSHLGLASLASAAGPLASMVAGTSSNTAYYATSAAANATQTAIYEKQRQDAAAAMSSAAQSNIRKGDQVAFEYKLARPGDSTPVVSQTKSAKAAENGQDVLSPMVEQAADELLQAMLK